MDKKEKPSIKELKEKKNKAIKDNNNIIKK